MEGSFRSLFKRKEEKPEAKELATESETEKSEIKKFIKPVSQKEVRKKESMISDKEYGRRRKRRIMERETKKKNRKK